MALARNGRRNRHVDYWPGFVDMLSTLLLTIMFLLIVFVLGQFLLGREISGKDVVLNRLHSQINELTQLLSLEKAGRQDTEDQLANLRASLAEAQQEKSRLRRLLDQGAGSSSAAQARISDLRGSLEDQKQVSQRALSQVELLNQQITALRSQIAALEDALGASEKKDAQSQTKIADLGRRLNVALARRVQELNRYRSDFFGRLREILADRNNIRIVGDRFVFQSEVLFASGSAEIGADGKRQLAQLGTTLLDVASRIPADLEWVLRIDGHTDKLPIRTTEFPSNWELSTARAVSVVKQLIAAGVPANRLAAAGFGQYHPLDDHDDEISYRRNRRIEIKLTER